MPVQESLRVFKGSYSEYKEFLNDRGKPAEPAIADEKLADEVGKPARKGLSRNQRQQLQKKIAAVEAKVHLTETEKALLETQLATPPAEQGKLQKIAEKYAEVTSRLENLLSEWEKLAHALHSDEQATEN